MAVVALKETGWSGVAHYDPMITGVDFNPTFDSLQTAISTFDRMYQSDSQIYSLVRMIAMPIASADFDVQTKDKGIKRFIESVLFDPSSPVNMNTFLQEAALHLVHGFAPFEKVWEKDGISPGKLTISKIAYRKPNSVYGWKYRDGTDELQAMVQNPRESISANSYQYVEIPRERLVIFVSSPEGANPQGRSTFRTAYAPWYMKEAVMRILGIHHERWGAGIPRGSLPEEEAGSAASGPVIQRMEANLRALRSHEHGYVIDVGNMKTDMLPAPSTMQASTMLESMRYFDNAIAKCVLAQFSNVGSGEIGSKSSAEVLRDLFVLNVQAVADSMADTITRQLVTDMVTFNFKRKNVPRIVASNVLVDLRINDVINAISQAAQAQVITPGPELNEVLRKYLRLPPSATEKVITKEEIDGKEEDNRADGNLQQAEV